MTSFFGLLFIYMITMVCIKAVIPFMINLLKSMENKWKLDQDTWKFKLEELKVKYYRSLF